METKHHIEFLPWPPPDLEFYSNETKCLFCDNKATTCAYHKSPYHFTIANRCCESQDCKDAAVYLLKETIKFDEEVNGRY